MTKTIWPTKPKIFAIQPFTRKVYRKVLRDSVHDHVQDIISLFLDPKARKILGDLRFVLIYVLSLK